MTRRPHDTSEPETHSDEVQEARKWSREDRNQSEPHARRSGDEQTAGTGGKRFASEKIEREKDLNATNSEVNQRKCNM